MSLSESVISADLCMSPYRPDHILPTKNGPWRVVSEGSTRTSRATSLLIVRTGRVVTAPKNSSAGYSEFPAYSQVLLRQRYVTLGPFLMLLLGNMCFPERPAHF